MRFVRLRLLALALVVVTGQLASTVAASVVLCQSRAATGGAAADNVVCTCAHGPMSECPMHKGHGTHGTPGAHEPDSSSRGTRWCAGCGETPEMVVTTLSVAGPVERHRHVAPQTQSQSHAASVERVLDVVLPLISPPPRA